MKVRDEAICQKAAQLWSQAVEEGYQETDDKSGLTIEMFKGSHYAIGALKGFWTPTEDGFLVINQTISDLERLLSGEEIVTSADEGDKYQNDKAEPLTTLRRQSSEVPDPRVSWRITRSGDGSDNYTYTTIGVNGNSIRKYYEDVKPGRLVEIDGREMLPREIPLDYAFEDDNLTDSLLIWIESEVNVEVIRDPSKQFEVDIEINYLEGYVSVTDLGSTSSYPWGTYNLSEYEYKLIDALNEIIESFDNFRVIHLGG